MPTTFRAANIANNRERKRLLGLISNVKSLRNVNNNWNAEKWRNVFEENNIPAFQALYQAIKRDPEAYKLSKLRKNLDNVTHKRFIRLAMYGYVPKLRKNWVYRGMMLVPPSIPEREAPSFRRVGKTGPGSDVYPIGEHINMSKFRNAYQAHIQLRPFGLSE